jgi:type VI secretion system protein ImpA
MATPETIEVKGLLEPIPGEGPAGADLRADPSPGAAIRAIKSAFDKAYLLERKGDPEAPPDWTPVVEGATAALAKASKDFHVASWLAVALVREHGFPGLRDGFRLLRGLAEGFWDALYPRPDDEGIGYRLSVLTGLNDGSILVDHLEKLPLTEGTGAGPFARWHYRKAEALEGVTDPERKEKLCQAPDAVTVEKLRKAEAETSPGFCRDLRDDLTGCLAELDGLMGLLEAKCGKDRDGHPLAPPSSRIRNALKGCLDIVDSYAGEKIPAGPVEGAEAAAGPSDPKAADPAAPRAAWSGKIRSRAEAFQALLLVARYFKDTEPHSPLSYALERVVRWGKMSLPELLSELIAEEGSRTNVFKLVGIPEPEPPSPPSS